MKAFLEYKFGDYVRCEIIVEPKLSFSFRGNPIWSDLKIKTELFSDLLELKPRAFMLTLLEDDGFVIKVFHFSDVTEYVFDEKSLEIIIKFEYLSINH